MIPPRFLALLAVWPLALPAENGGAISEAPATGVRVEIFEFPMKGAALAAETYSSNDSDPAKDDGGAEASWEKLPPNKTEEFLEPAFALTALPHKYTASGVRADRSRPFLVRLAGTVTLPPAPPPPHHFTCTEVTPGGPRVFVPVHVLDFVSLR